MQWDELRHAAAVIGTVLYLCVRPRYWARTVRNLLARQVLAVGVELVGIVTLRIVLPEAGAAGIRQGSEVYFLGTLMGTVSDVTVDPAGRMEAQVTVQRHPRKRAWEQSLICLLKTITQQYPETPATGVLPYEKSWSITGRRCLRGIRLRASARRAGHELAHVS